MTKLPRTTINLIMSLLTEHSWLGPKANSILELLDLCSTLEEQELLIDLIKLIDYLHPNSYQECLEQISNIILVKYGLTETNTMLVSFSVDDQADSGQVVLYDVRTQLTVTHGWRNTRTVNVLGKAQRYVSEYPNVILIDEFVGTGISLVGRIQALRKHFHDKNIVNFTIFPIVVAGMAFGLDHVYEVTGCRPFAVKELKKGISEQLPESLRYKARELMLKLENTLKPKIGSEDLPSFGYGNAEALYGREYGNCPNSVFPIFWWPYDNNDRSRETFFHRNTGIS